MSTSRSHYYYDHRNVTDIGRRACRDDWHEWKALATDIEVVNNLWTKRVCARCDLIMFEVRPREEASE